MLIVISPSEGVSASKSAGGVRAINKCFANGAEISAASRTLKMNIVIAGELGASEQAEASVCAGEQHNQ